MTIQMSFYVAILGASVSLGLGIPVFMDKVMRPRYEDRFEEFRQASRETFMEMFEDALKKLKQTKEWISDETITVMESLFSEWGQIKTNENRLQNAIEMRKHLFVGWMVSALLSTFSIKYSDYDVIRELKLGQLTEIVFFALLVMSMVYGLTLFLLDEKLSKYRGVVPRERPPSEVQTLISMLERGREMEKSVETFLKSYSVQYDRRPISAKGRTVVTDFAIPSSKDPKYVIEVRRAVTRRAILFDLYDRLERIRRAFPKVKGILVLDLGETPKVFVEETRKMWDFVIDFKNLDDIRDVITVRAE